jgi:hypothetical protein
VFNRLYIKEFIAKIEIYMNLGKQKFYFSFYARVGFLTSQGSHPILSTYFKFLTVIYYGIHDNNY